MESTQLQTLLRQMEQVVIDSEQLVRAVANHTSADVTQAREQAQRSLATAKQHIDQSKQYARRIGLATRRQIRDRPWQSLGIAAGAGVLLGAWLRRR